MPASGCWEKSRRFGCCSEKTGLFTDKTYYIILKKVSSPIINALLKTIIKNYAVPRIGLRAFPFKKTIYADASFGWSFNLSGTEKRPLGQSTYSAKGGGFIYFLQLGARFGVTKNKK
jgi:hypothetical protein